jgi:hypothetical protein
MKRLILTSIVMMVAMVSGFAQNLVIWDSVAHFLPPDTNLIRSGPVDNEKEMCKYLAIKNNSSAPIPVCVKKVILDTIPGSKNYLCWVRCYSDKIYAPTDTVLLGPQKTDYYHFVGHYRPMDRNGSSTVRYVFYDRYHPTDTASVRITFVPSNVGITEVTTLKNSISATPNPANEEIKFNYTLTPGTTGKIILLQITGTIISETAVQEMRGSLILDTREMRDGLYFYYLMVDGNVCSAKKLVIRHQ